jgi:hypothetical protein
MTISTRDQLINALSNNCSRLVIDKASISNAAAGQLFSLWRATGQPGQGAIPTSAALCTKALTGALSFDNQNDPATSYLAWLSLICSNSALSIEIHDRIAHMGGLVLNVTTSQAVTGLDLLTLNPPSERLGASNYSDGQWFLECYTDGGTTASNATINVTYDDGSTGNLNAVGVGTLRAGRSIALTPLIPIAQQGKIIRAPNSVILSASTGTAGNLGFTYARQRSVLPILVANMATPGDWATLGNPVIPNDSCLYMMMTCSTTTTGTVRGQGKIAHG